MYSLSNHEAKVAEYWQSFVLHTSHYIWWGQNRINLLDWIAAFMLIKLDLFV